MVMFKKDLIELTGLINRKGEIKMQNMNIDIYKCERIIEQAREFYSHTLNRSEGLYAREFIEHKLGLNEDTVKKYHLGCSPASPYGLTEYLTSHGFSEEEIIEAGLAVRDKNGFCEDRFKDFRVIIPFCDAHGKPLGFGGLSVNTIGSNLKMTPISEVFRRNEIVFGLNETRVARSDVLILTNNIMNVFALTNTSYHNVACPATSSLSQMQACEIKSLYDEVVILVDEDSRHR